MTAKTPEVITAAQDLLDYLESHEHELDEKAYSFVSGHMLGAFKEAQELARKSVSILNNIETIRKELTFQRLKLRRNINIAFSALIGAVIILTSLIGPNRYFVFFPAVAVLLVGQVFILWRWLGKRRALSYNIRRLSELEAEGDLDRQKCDQTLIVLQKIIDFLERRPRGCQ